MIKKLNRKTALILVSVVLVVCLVLGILAHLRFSLIKFSEYTPNTALNAYSEATVVALTHIGTEKRVIPYTGINSDEISYIYVVLLEDGSLGLVKFSTSDGKQYDTEVLDVPLEQPIVIRGKTAKTPRFSSDLPPSLDIFMHLPEGINPPMEIPSQEEIRKEEENAELANKMFDGITLLDTIALDTDQRKSESTFSKYMKISAVIGVVLVVLLILYICELRLKLNARLGSFFLSYPSAKRPCVQREDVVFLADARKVICHNQSPEGVASIEIPDHIKTQKQLLGYLVENHGFCLKQKRFSKASNPMS